MSGCRPPEKAIVFGGRPPGALRTGRSRGSLAGRVAALLRPQESAGRVLHAAGRAGGELIGGEYGLRPAVARETVQLLGLGLLEEKRSRATTGDPSSRRCFAPLTSQAPWC
jgi:hypothetical protein